MVFSEKFDRDFLTAAVKDSKILSRFVGVVDADVFSRSAYAKLWILLSDFWSKYKEAPSEASFIEMVADGVDEGMFLREEVDFLEENVPRILCPNGEPLNSSFIVDRVSEWIRERRLRRQLSEAVKLVRQGKAGVDAIVDLVKNAEIPSDIESINKSDFIETLPQRLESLKSEEFNSYVSSGIEWLDTALGGGIKRGFKGIVMGPPGGGKTTFVIHMAVKCILTGGSVVYLYNDESESAVDSRFASALACLPTLDLVSPEGREVLERVRKTLKERRGKLYVHRLPYLSKPSTVQKIVERLHDENQKVDLIIVDHIGNMQDDSSKEQDSWLAIGRIFNSIGELASRYRCVTLCVAHTKREAEGRGIINDNRLIGLSYEPVKHADIILAAWRNPEDKASGDTLKDEYMRIQVTKVRGPGSGAKVRLRADFERCDLQPVARWTVEDSNA